MADLANNKIVARNKMAFHTLDEARNHLVIGLQGFERLKLFLSVVGRFQNQEGHQIDGFHGRKAFRIKIFFRNEEGIDSYSRNFFMVVFQYMRLQSFCTVRKWNVQFGHFLITDQTAVVDMEHQYAGSLVFVTVSGIVT